MHSGESVGDLVDRPGRAQALGAIQSFVGLLILFGAIILWFRQIDFYHRHFFDSGLVVVADNLFRAAFVAVLFWLVLGIGLVIAQRVLPRNVWLRRPAIERIAFGFAIGAGLWHVVLLAVGVLGLYYRSVMILLCLAAFVASAGQLHALLCEFRVGVVTRYKNLCRGLGVAEAIGIVVFLLVAAWLLLVRALYPGGGGDYYTHYFPYYLTVVQNHSLAPNEVWYHYFYSKGDGLFFLGMLLTDPEAPALATFCTVFCAALALAALSARMFPKSLWPVCGPLLYLLFYIVSVSWGYGGDFQKEHEFVTGLVVLTVWAICMAQIEGQRAFLVAAVSSAVAAAIITQAMGIMLAFFFGALSAVSLARACWAEVRAYGLGTILIGTTVLGVYVLSYVQTGLASDQPLDLMLRFADFKRLDNWGVIPEIVLIRWIEDNYAAVAPQSASEVVLQLARFLRLDVLWPFVVGIFAILSEVAARKLLSPAKAAPVANGRASVVTLIHVGAMIGLFVLIAGLAGRVQYVSFTRFSTFFVPLLITTGIAISGWMYAQGRGPNWLLRVQAPVLLLLSVLVWWQVSQNWGAQVLAATSNGIALLTGRYSLYQAYTQQGWPLAGGVFPFGGINPGALAAARELPPNTPIWSTNVDAYCVVPGCLVKSMASYKTPRLDTILTSPPNVAMEALRQAGLNYFLFQRASNIIDPLPYSPLFSPEVIGQYFALKWSDGSSFLLTWKAPGLQPLGLDFLQAYTARLNAPEHAWFQFRHMLPYFAVASAQLRASRTFGKQIEFAWRNPPVDVVSATYGENCLAYVPAAPNTNTVRKGNVTAAVARACAIGSDQTGAKACRFRVGVQLSGRDPANGCAKDFSVVYRCRPDEPEKTSRIDPEADGKTVSLDCTGANGRAE
jgi:hypothetical protein